MNTQHIITTKSFTLASLQALEQKIRPLDYTELVLGDDGCYGDTAVRVDVTDTELILKGRNDDVELTCQISDIRSIEQCIQNGMPYIRIQGEWAYNEGGFVQHEKQACLYVVHDTLVSPAEILSGRYKPEEETENRINHQEAKPSFLRVLAAFMCRPSPVC